jgi:hypothetical protein
MAYPTTAIPIRYPVVLYLTELQRQRLEYVVWSIDHHRTEFSEQTTRDQVRLAREQIDSPNSYEQEVQR